jgi:hypothetical protein
MAVRRDRLYGCAGFSRKNKDAAAAPLHARNYDAPGPSDAALREFYSYLGIASVATLSVFREAWTDQKPTAREKMLTVPTASRPRLVVAMTAHDYRKDALIVAIQIGISGRLVCPTAPTEADGQRWPS